MPDETHLEVREIAAAGYRTLRSIRFPVRRLSVFVGANGVGKTNLYRALQLLQAAAAGNLSRELAAEGGMESALWAGKRQAKKPARIRLMVGLGNGAPEPQAGDARPDYSYEVSAGLVHSYAVDIGVRVPTGAAFALEPQVKEEALTFHHGPRQTKMLERRGPSVYARDVDGRRSELGANLMASETALGSLADPARFPDLHMIRQIMLDWRFYHDFRTDAAAALRRPCLAVATPTLASDGSDLAAVFATLVHIREDTHRLDRVIDDAFPGARLVVPEPGRTASFGLIFPEYPQRLFDAGELSDGTLRYLALAGALLAYRLPAFVALNEPETSLHPDLLRPLARLIAEAAERTQIWMVTHSQPLAAALADHAGVTPLHIIKRDGETWIEGLKLGGGFRDDDE
jgi:predicted ATPase